MFGSNFVEIGIGLSLLFLLLSLMCSMASEIVATRLSWRSSMLEQGIRDLLHDPAVAEQLYRHPLVTGLGRKSSLSDPALLRWAGVIPPLGRWLRKKAEHRSKPPYIPSHLFARALLDIVLFMPRVEAYNALRQAILTNARAEIQSLGTRVDDAEFEEAETFTAKLTQVGESIERLETDADARKDLVALLDRCRACVEAPQEGKMLDQIHRAIDKLTDSDLRRALHVLMERGEIDDLVEARAAVARWFDDGMDRVSGWYKRKSQTLLFGVAIIITIALNIDTFLIADRLARDTTLRALVVAAGESAEQYRDARFSGSQAPAQGGLVATTGAATTGQATPAGAGTSPQAAAPVSGATEADENASASIARFQRLKAEIDKLHLPIGWPTREEEAKTAQIKAEKEIAAAAMTEKEKAAVEKASLIAAEQAAREKELKELPADSTQDLGDKATAAVERARTEAAQARAAAESARVDGVKAREQAAIATREAENERAFPRERSKRVSRLFGWLFTALAASLGAQFWFDVLSRITNLRASGKKPETSPPAGQR